MKVPLVLLVSEAVPVFVQSLKVRFQKRKYFLSIPCINARRPQTGYESLLLLHKASRFGDVPLNTGKVIFEAHIAGRTTPWHSGFEPSCSSYGARLMPNRRRNRLLLLGHE
jgi:hypothetical protein